MKRVKMLVFVLSLVCSATLFGQEKANDKTPWMDLEHCAFCKNMSSQLGLIQHVRFDFIKIPNGMITVAFVPDNLKEAMKKANEGMQATVKEMQSGKQLTTCAFCDAIGLVMAKGAKVEKFQGESSEVSLFTSTDAEVVKSIHAIADRTNEEAQKTKAHHETKVAPPKK